MGLQRLPSSQVPSAGMASDRRPLGGALVELRHGPKAEHASRWLQVSHTFQPAVARLEVPLEQTTVSLAFNLEGEEPTQQQVYAFLPLRSYGLCFIVQVTLLHYALRVSCCCGRCCWWTHLYRICAAPRW